MLAFDTFWHMDFRSFHSINNAIMVLLPKAEEAKMLRDYRPIALIHCFGKLISKVMSARLAPYLKDMLHQDQSAFIKGRTIHDNFRFVQASAKALYARRAPRILLKVDIAKAIDSVAWAFLIEIMEHLGFPWTWIDWITTLLYTAMTRVAINGSAGEKIQHARGLRQGNPLSPMLFLLVMEVLSALIRKADIWQLFQGLGVRNIPHRVSLYADDLVIFLSPTQPDLQMMKVTLQIFQEASGLSSNMSKCQLAPIRCQLEDLCQVQSTFPCIITDFPMKYLGIPLYVTKLPKTSLQPIIDKG